MKKWFFPILVGWFILGWASVASGCANGASAEPVRRRADAGVRMPARISDAGVDKPDAFTAGVPMPGGVDAGRALPDAGTFLSGGVDAGSAVRRDAGVPVAPPPPPPPPDTNLVRIRLTPELQAQCALGWRIRLWLTATPEESVRGAPLERSIVPGLFGPWSSVSLWCDERTPPWEVWDAADLSALGSGAFAELSMDGVDLRSSTMLCEDPFSPGTGFRPILMWDAARRGSCPP